MNRAHTQVIALLLSIAGTSLDCSAPPSAPPPEHNEDYAVGTSGMVSSAHPLATQAGLDILEAGGNAFDAAVAIAATLNVTEPMMSGMGGYGTIVTYDAEGGRARFLNSSGRIPKALDSDVFRPPTPDYEGNRRGAKAVSTPGNLNAWEAMSKEYGTLEWKKLFEPAIRAAEEGFPTEVRELLAAKGHKILVRGRLGNAHGLTIEYGPEGEPVRFTGGSDPRGEGLAKGSHRSSVIGHQTSGEQS